MKLSQSKPDFYKPILPGFKNGLKIPARFSKYILGREENFSDEAVLKKKGKKWRVGVRNGCFQGHRWDRFAEENHLEAGDFVEFKLRGNMVFHVIIYDGITQVCKRDRVTDEEPQKLEVLAAGDRQETPVVRMLHSMEMSEDDKGKGVIRNVSIGFPSYTSTLKAYCTNRKNRCFHVDLKFARENGLCGKSRMTLANKSGRRWRVSLRLDKWHLYIIKGWAKFVDENGLKEGDAFKFELVENGEVPLARFTVIPDTY